MAFRPAQPLPRPLRALAARPRPGRSRSPCRPPRAPTAPARGAACPYVAASQVGQRAEGVMRFPQARRRSAPTARSSWPTRARTWSRSSGPTASFRREVGIAGHQAGPAQRRRRHRGGRRRLGAGGRRDEPHRPLRRQRAAHRLLGRGRAATSASSASARAAATTPPPAAASPSRGDFVYVADTGNDRIQRFTLDGGHGADDRPARACWQPAAGSRCAARALSVADDRTTASSSSTPAGTCCATVGAGTGSGPGQLNYPYDVASDAAGRVFVADDLNHRVVRFSSAAALPVQGPLGLVRDRAGRLAYPRGIAVEPQGKVYVANTGNDRIDVFDQRRHAAALVRRVGPLGGPVRRADGRRGRRRRDPRGDRLRQRPHRAAQRRRLGRRRRGARPAPGPTILPKPVAVAFDARRQRLRPRPRRSRIVVFTRATGLPVRTIGSPGSGPGQLLNPSALTIDGGGTIVGRRLGQPAHRALRHRRRLPGRDHRRRRRARDRGDARRPRTYVSTANHRIEVFDPSGSEVDEFGGQGNKLGKLESPGQIALDAAGNLWVADRGNNRIQEFGPDGERLLAFGQRGVGLGEFVHPTGVSVDCHGAAHRHRQRQQPRAAVRPGRAGDRAVRRARRRSATRRRPSCRRCPRPWARR